MKGYGYKANYFDVETGDEFWISGPKKKGGNGLYGDNGAEIDEDVRIEYWVEIRNLPDNKDSKVVNR